MAHVESAAITSLNVSLARSYQKECSSATPRSKRRCASARHDVGNVTRPSASRCPPCSWTACAGSPAAASVRAASAASGVRADMAQSSRTKALQSPSRCSADSERQRRVEIEIDETERIDCEAAVRSEPVEVRAGHASRRADVADQLTAADGVPHGDEGATEMEVSGDEAGPVVDENGGAAQVQVGDEGDDAAVCRTHGRAGPPGEIDAEVTAPQNAVEHPRHSEAACHGPRARTQERLPPEPWRVVRPSPDFLYLLALPPDPLGERLRRLHQIGGCVEPLARRPTSPHGQ